MLLPPPNYSISKKCITNVTIAIIEPIMQQARKKSIIDKVSY